MAELPRTIDNLGIEPSTRWAKDQSLKDIVPQAESASITRQAEIDVFSPSYPSEFALLFGELDKQLSWGIFKEPQGFSEQKKRLFTYQILPVLSSDERLEAQIERVKTLLTSALPSTTEALSWEADREKLDTEQEKTKMLHLLDSLHLLNRFLVDINAKRVQYQKG